jgi:hypothetical protein
MSAFSIVILHTLLVPFWFPLSMITPFSLPIAIAVVSRWFLAFSTRI